MMSQWLPGSVLRFASQRRLPNTPNYIQYSPPSMNQTVRNPFQAMTSINQNLENSFQACTSTRQGRELSFHFPKGMFQTGRRFRIVSMATGRALQIVQSLCTGCFFVNASGALNVEPDHTCNSAWTVVSKGNGRFQFYCNGFYLSVVGGYPTVSSLNLSTPQHTGEIRRTWEVEMLEGHLYLRSVSDDDQGTSSCRTPFLSAADSGELHHVGACTSYQRSNQFGVQLLPTLNMLKEDAMKNAQFAP